MDAIRDSTKALQETLYSRSAVSIREHLKQAIELNRHGEGPSAKALKQAEDYAEKVDKYMQEQEAERQREVDELRQEIEGYNLEEALDPSRMGVAKAGFVRNNPVECTQRRLFVKILLRRARAYELLGDLEAASRDLRVVERVEPENREARQRSKALVSALNPQPEPEPAAGPPSATTVVSDPGKKNGRNLIAPGIDDADKAKLVSGLPTAAKVVNVDAAEPAVKQSRETEASDLAGDDEEEVFDHAATASLLASAADYMKRNDYQGALQIYNYVRRRCRDWESPLVELKVMSNTSLCLQRLRGRLPELIKACSETLQRIAELRAEAPDAVPRDTLLNMECAVLSRRGNAYSQQQRQDESNRDAARVRELLGKSS